MEIKALKWLQSQKKHEELLPRFYFSSRGQRGKGALSLNSCRAFWIFFFLLLTHCIFEVPLKPWVLRRI